MLTTNDDELAEKLQMLRNHGASVSEEQRHHGPKPYLLPEFNLLGYNYRMTDLQGAVGLVQLQKLEAFIEERSQWAAFYREQLQHLNWLKLPQTSPHYRHGWQSFVTMVDEAKAPMSRNKLMEYLQSKGISTRPGTHAVHMLTYYQEKYGFRPKDFPGAMNANNHSMAIPLHNRMEEEDYHYVVDIIRAL